MNEEIPAVLISVEESIPHEWVEEFAVRLHQAGVETKEERRESGPAAGIEWLLPTAIVVVFTSYLAAMASQAGKDHYDALKKAIRRLAERVRERRVTRIATSPGKMSRERPGQLTIALHGRDGIAIRFVLPSDEDHVHAALDAFFRLAGDPTWGQALFRRAAQVREAGTARWKIIARFSEKTGKWQLYDPTTERTWSIDEEKRDIGGAT